MMTDAPVPRTASIEVLVTGSPDPAVVRASQGRVLELADMILPEYGAPSRPTDATPR